MNFDHETFFGALICAVPIIAICGAMGLGFGLLFLSLPQAVGAGILTSGAVALICIIAAFFIAKG